MCLGIKFTLTGVAVIFLLLSEDGNKVKSCLKLNSSLLCDWLAWQAGTDPHHHKRILMIKEHFIV